MTDQSESIEEELFRGISKQSTIVFGPILFVAFLIAAMVESPPGEINLKPWFWFIAVFVILTIRWRVLGHWLPSTDARTGYKMRVVILLSFINGLVHASSLIFFGDLGTAGRELTTVFLLAMATAAVATTNGYRPVFLVYSIPVYVAVFLGWVLVNDAQEGSMGLVVEIGAPVMMLIYGGILYGLARDYFSRFKESFDIRLQEKKLNQKLQKALKETTRANESKTRFLAAASHDLRQPIQTLSFFSAALMTRDLDEKTQQITERMDQAIKSLATQMDLLLDISKLDAGIVEVIPRKFNLYDYVQEIYASCSPEIYNKGLKFEIPDKGAAWVETDYQQFDRIVRNLLSNAVKHTATGSIRIRIREAPGHWLFRVEDTGEGISTEEQKKIFDEFYQVKNPHRDRTEGLGLGLAIVKRLTKLLDISVQLDSEPEQGTLVTLEVPKAQAPLLQNQADAGAQQTVSMQNIMCVDDNKEVLEALKVAMEEFGFDATVATGTEEALALARERAPDVLLADYQLSDDDNGLDTIRRFQQEWPGLPAFLISGDTNPETLKLINSHGIEMLHKPLDPWFLLKKIRQHIHTPVRAGSQ